MIPAAQAVRARRYAESLMGSTCIVTRIIDRVLNEETGEYNDVPKTIYTGRCRLVFHASLEALARDMEGQILAEQRPTLELPITGSEQVTVNDVATIISNPYDAAAVGMKIRVTGLSAASYATARRLPGEVLT